MLYSIHNDRKHYAALAFDWKQIVALFGDSMETRIDVNPTPNRYAAIWNPEITVSFDHCGGLTGSQIPDIAEHQGRLFVNAKAYDILHPLLESDGEWLPVITEQGQGYLFNPLRLAEDSNALDESLCVRNEWDDVENVAFHEQQLAGIQAFRTAFDDYATLYCKETIKNAIEANQLSGIHTTASLGQPAGLASNGPH